MIAQAHAAAQKMQLQANEEGSIQVPHPPNSPRNKPHTAHPHRANAR